MTNAMRGFVRKFCILRVEPSVSKTISNRSVTAIPTTAACGRWACAYRRLHGEAMLTEKREESGAIAISA